MEPQVKIIVDNREMRSRVARYAYSLGAKIETAQLEVGDYILSDKVCVERKTINDFLSSLMDTRLFPQLMNLKSNFEHPLIILEGTDNIFTMRRLNPAAIRGALIAIAVRLGIPIIRTKDSHETAEYLYAIAKKEQVDNKVSISLHGEKKPTTDRELQEYIVTSIPGVGREIARNLLAEFGTIKNIVNATTEELQKVNKVGAKKAAEINRVFEIIYSKPASRAKKIESHNVTTT